jgi:hypothetical protein
MSSYTGLSPKGPRDYVGPNVYLQTVVTRHRAPTSADYRQPETGKVYPVGSFWMVGSDPTTGVEGDLWVLSKIVANVAYWVMLAAGGGSVLFYVDVQAATLPGVDPVQPDGGGIITVNGAAVANHGVPLETHTRALNAFNLEVQYAGSAAASDATLSGISHFNSAQFDVDADGFVSLAGGGLAIDSVALQAGTTPIVPDGTGQITLNGAVVAAGTNPFRSNGTGPNTAALEVQFTQAVAATDATRVGLAAFDSAVFTVDANGFVSLAGGSQAIDSIGVDATSGGGTNPVLPTAAGLITNNGAVVAAGTNPIRTVSTAVNVYQTQVQISQAIAATDATKIGLCNFDSAFFSVDANGFVTFTGGAGFTWSDVLGAFSPLKNNGYFITGTATGTLPASPTQGDTIQFFVDHASQLLTIQTAGTQIIRMGTLVSSAGGTFVSSQQGDSIELVYRSANTCWEAVDWVGTWSFT